MHACMQVGRTKHTLLLHSQDATETETDYLLRIDLPGFSAEEVDIELQGDKLTVSAKKDEGNNEAASGKVGVYPCMHLSGLCAAQRLSHGALAPSAGSTLYRCCGPSSSGVSMQSPVLAFCHPTLTQPCAACRLLPLSPAATLRPRPRSAGPLPPSAAPLRCPTMSGRPTSAPAWTRAC